MVYETYCVTSKKYKKKKETESSYEIREIESISEETIKRKRTQMIEKKAEKDKIKRKEYEYMYVDESNRSMYERGKEHENMFRDINERNITWRNILTLKEKI